MKKIFLASLLALGPYAAIAQSLETIKFDGKDRTMMVYVPEDLPDNAPLVITLHGANQSAEYQRDHTKWNTVADTAKFVVVYPNAINAFWDTSGQSDVRFISHIMDLMKQRHNIDTNRIYLSGFSLGAMMCYQCIEHLGNKIAAFGPVSGVRFDNRAPIAPRIVPIIHTHCKGDDVFKWEGDPGHMAGGYPYIPDYVKSWAIYEGMDPKPEVIDPYPADKPNSDCDKTIYRRADSVVEVVLLSFDGAGHWHVDADAWGGVSTTKEIWDFCKRYTLNTEELEPPVMLNVEPEDGSFDLTASHNLFTFTFDRPASISDAKATLKGDSQDIDLICINNQEDNVSESLNFKIPDNTSVPDGNYTLELRDVKLPKGDFSHSYHVEYTYGIEEVGDKMKVDTIFSQNWDGMVAANGERIPQGWQRVATMTDGTQVTTTSSQDPDNGSRLVHICDEGEITTGLYLAAVDASACNMNYGRISGNMMSLQKGRYMLTLNAAYWNKSAERAKTKFDLTVKSKTNRGTGYDTPISETGLTPTGCVSIGSPIYGTARYEYIFKTQKKDNYVINLDINGKTGVCIGNIVVSTAPTNADKYKGEFLRLLAKANSLYEYLIENQTADMDLTDLKNAIDQYSSFSSTSPSAYTEAINNLTEAMTPWSEYVQASISSTLTDYPYTTLYYTIDGRTVDANTNGLIIKKDIYDNGTVKVQKIIR